MFYSYFTRITGELIERCQLQTFQMVGLSTWMLLAARYIIHTLQPFLLIGYEMIAEEGQYNIHCNLFNSFILSFFFFFPLFPPFIVYFSLSTYIAVLLSSCYEQNNMGQTKSCTITSTSSSSSTIPNSCEEIDAS